MKVLITGTGITGKSMFRRKLVEDWRRLGFTVEHFDADRFKELRHPVDGDCIKELPKVFMDCIIYFIEDVHGPIADDAVMPLDHYDLIFYLKPSRLSLLIFWLDRIPRWIKSGQHSWEPSLGWRGTGKPNDWRNLWPIAKEFYRNMAQQGLWVKQDLANLCPFKYKCKIVESRWTKQGLKFKVQI